MRQIPDHGKLDVWSIACVLLEMIMGCRWFNNEWLSPYSTYIKREKQLRAEPGGSTRAFEDLQVSLSQSGAVRRGSNPYLATPSLPWWHQSPPSTPYVTLTPNTHPPLDGNG